MGRKRMQGRVVFGPKNRPKFGPKNLAMSKRPKATNQPKSAILVKAPQAQGMITRPYFKSANIVETATELLTILKVSADDTAGTIILNYPLSPQVLYNSRLRQFSRLYSQYRFRALTLEIVPANSTTANGSIAYCLDRNVSQTPVNAQAANYVYSVADSIAGPMWEPLVIKADCSKSRLPFYATSLLASPETSTQFRILAAIEVPLTTSTGPFAVMLRLKYTCEFAEPINSSVFDSGLLANESVAAGTSLTISTSGRLTGFSLPAGWTGTTANGYVFAVAPSLSEGLIDGAQPVRAVILNTKTDGSLPILLCYPDLAGAFSSVPVSGIGPCNGNNVATTTDVPIEFICVGKVSANAYTS